MPPIPAVPAVINTPVPSRGAAFAALHTAGSISHHSEISSLGCSGVSSGASENVRRPVTRRNRNSEDYDSDDDATEAEDTYEVDFGENFWDPGGMQQQELVDDEAPDAGQGQGTDDVEEFPAGAPVNDFARLLEGCRDFGFKELSDDEAKAMPAPPKLYSAGSGVRWRVASSFTTPLGAFAKSGFSERLIAGWVKNSNR
jgi:hypothetical protein